MRIRPVILAVSVGTAAVLVLPAAAAGDTAISVPAAGPMTVRTTFSGTVPLGGNVTLWADNPSSCKGDISQFVESHPIKVSVPTGAYDVVKANMSVTVDSSPTLAGDFIELLDPSGSSVGTDGQHPEDEIDVVNPQAGTWTLLTCMFIPDSAGPHDYSGTVTIKTKCKAASPCLAAPRKKKK
jgi:hypothetical protein